MAPVHHPIGGVHHGAGHRLRRDPADHRPRPSRTALLNILLYGSATSPLLWDVASIMLYLTASSIYLYIPMIPDLAVIRDLGISPRTGCTSSWHRIPDTESQRRLLEKMIAVLAIAVIPIAISVHTVIGWIFALTLRPMWHSTIFGPYFVMGAIYSGIAALIIAMAILRRVYRLEAYFKDVHFNNMGKLLLLMSCLWFYFTFAEYLTAWYGGEEAEMATFWSKVSGPYAFPFWLMVASCTIIPVRLMCFHRRRAACGARRSHRVFVVLGMWLERFNIVVPTSQHPRLEMSMARITSRRGSNSRSWPAPLPGSSWFTWWPRSSSPSFRCGRSKRDARSP